MLDLLPGKKYYTLVMSIKRVFKTKVNHIFLHCGNKVGSDVELLSALKLPTMSKQDQQEVRYFWEIYRIVVCKLIHKETATGRVCVPRLARLRGLRVQAKFRDKVSETFCCESTGLIREISKKSLGCHMQLSWNMFNKVRVLVAQSIPHAFQIQGGLPGTIKHANKGYFEQQLITYMIEIYFSTEVFIFNY